MLPFVLRRLAIIPLVLLLANFLGYAYAHFAQPLQIARDPRFRGSPPDAPPLLPFYTDYLRGMVQLDFGTLPYASGQASIAGAVLSASVASFVLLGLALLLSTLIGMALGVRAVKANPPRLAPWLTLSATVGLAMPGFYLGSLVIAAVILHLLATGNSQPILPIQGFGWDAHLILPTLVLMLRPTAQIAQVTGSLLVGELGKPYVQTARSLGHPWKAIFQRYALRNVLAAVIVTISGSLRLLVGELIIVERLFSWPGLGNMVSQTLVPANLAGMGQSQIFLDPPTMALLLMVFALLFLLTDLVASVLIQSFDPRLRTT